MTKSEYINNISSKIGVKLEKNELSVILEEYWEVAYRKGNDNGYSVGYEDGYRDCRTRVDDLLSNL